MVSDTYSVRYLLQATQATPARVHWRERSSGGLQTTADGVDLLLEEIHTRPAVRLGLRFRYREDEFWLYSPLPVGWMGREYASEEDRELAELLRDLMHAATAQCAQRMNYDYEHPEEVRERVYQQLLFGQPTVALEEENELKGARH